MQIDKKFFITYKEVIMCVIIILIIFILGVQQIIAALVRVRDTSIELNKQKVKLNVANRELKKMQEQKQRLLFKQGKLKPFFEQVNAVNNSISSFGGMFEDIIDYIKLNKIMLRSVDYYLNPEEDPIYQQFPNLYNVCRVNVVMLCKYSQLQGFFKDLSYYPYFINIFEVRISPYEKDKNYVIAEVGIILYSKKRANN